MNIGLASRARRHWSLLILAGSALAPRGDCAGPASSSHVLEPEGAISLPGVKGGFDLMAVDVPGRRFFLAAEENGSLEILDLKAARRIYVNVPAANHIAVISRSQRKVITTWPVRAAKDNVPMGFDRASHRLFVPELDRFYLAVPAHDNVPAELRIYRPAAEKSQRLSTLAASCPNPVSALSHCSPPP